MARDRRQLAKCFQGLGWISPKCCHSLPNQEDVLCLVLVLDPMTPHPSEGISRNRRQMPKLAMEHKMKHIALSALILLGAPVAAMAGGPATPTIEPMISTPAPVMQIAQSGDWTGLYSGVSLGYGRSETKGLGQDGKMHIGGVNLGYRREMGTVVVGGELSYDRDNINVGAADRTINHTTALKLVVGKDLGRTLVYGDVGVARANATLAGVTATDTGYTVGIGADFALNQQWTVGGELSMNRYNDFNNTGVTLKDTAVTVKLGYRF
jgi:opacity protein-like surface antigen